MQYNIEFYADNWEKEHHCPAKLSMEFLDAFNSGLKKRSDYRNKTGRKTLSRRGGYLLRVLHDIENFIETDEKSIIENLNEKNITWHKKYTTQISKATNTLFRQNNDSFDSIALYYSLYDNKWKNEKATQRAIICFSRKSNILVFIPQKTVDEIIFNPFFKNYIEGYRLKDSYKEYSYADKATPLKTRINLTFKKAQKDKLLVSLVAKARFKKPSIKLMLLPSIYWPKIQFGNSNPVNKIIETIFHLNQKLSSAEGIDKII
ncbi:hypothetical protein HOD29_06640 [archaeon]|nr:hypothetical protein [archaeon]